MKKLQTLQNKAVRIIFRCDRFHSSEPLMKELHWLPVEKRITFKVLLLTYKGKNKLIPSYLANFLIHYTNRRPGLRSESANLLTVARTQRSHGDKAFCVAGPRLWESLPIRIRNSPSVNSFKKVLKTHLFPST